MLTERNYLNNNTLNEIIRLKVKKIFIIGGTGVITDKVEKNIRGLNVETERLSGADRYETNNKIINKFYENLSLKNIYIATSEDFPDALSGAALSQMSSSPIVLTPRKDNGIVRELLDSHKFLITNVNLLGGEQIVSNDSVNMDSYSQIKNAKRFLNIPTYDGSNQSVHPKVLYFPNGWNGWKYWMVYTP